MLFCKLRLTGNKSNSDDNNALRIIPNPNDGNFRIVSSDKSLNIVEIIDAQGSVITTINTSKKTNTIDIGGYTSGLYFLRCTFEYGEIITQKLIVY